MKAITEKQPWGYLICAGIKDIENRTWKTKFRGRVLIHTSAKPMTDNVPLLNFDQLSAVAEVLDDTTVMFANNGCIIGSVEIIDCVQNHPSVWAEKGVWNWVLDKPVLFETPIMEVKGKLSF